MAEFLIYAKDHWMDSLTQDEVDKLSPSMKEGYDRRVQKGDVIEVFPDGKCIEDVSPKSPYIIVKVPGLDYESAKEYLNPLTEDIISNEPDGSQKSYKKIIKRRKYKVPENYVNTIDSTQSKIVTTNEADMLSKITAKVN